ncbi:hypothetical protein [Clostridium saccharoperbutylacetonicum]
MKIGHSQGATMKVSFSSSQNIGNNIPKTKKDNDKSEEQKNVSNNSKNLSLKMKNDRSANLLKQKENINKAKNDFKDNALKQNMDPKAMKDKLDEYDKQLQDIDKEISQIEMEEQKKALNNEADEKKADDKTDNQTNSQNKNQNTGSDNTTDLMNVLVTSSENLTIIKQNKSINVGLKGEKNVLQSNIELDASRGSSKVDRDRLSKLDDTIKESQKNMFNSLHDISKNTEKINGDNLKGDDNIDSNSSKALEDFDAQNSDTDYDKNSLNSQYIKKYAENYEEKDKEGNTINSLS